MVQGCCIPVVAAYLSRQLGHGRMLPTYMMMDVSVWERVKGGKVDQFRESRDWLIFKRGTAAS
jgi:hypothetical protein